jgi:hypothetical protein
LGFTHYAELLQHPYDGAFSICETNGWKYIFVLPEKSLKTVHEELTLSKLRKPIAESYTVEQGWRIACTYRCQNEIPYQKHTLNWFQCLETRVKEVRHRACHQPVGGKKQNCQKPAGGSLERNDSKHLSNLIACMLVTNPPEKRLSAPEMNHIRPHPS